MHACVGCIVCWHVFASTRSVQPHGIDDGNTHKHGTVHIDPVWTELMWVGQVMQTSTQHALSNSKKRAQGLAARRTESASSRGAHLLPCCQPVHTSQLLTSSANHYTSSPLLLTTNTPPDLSPQPWQQSTRTERALSLISATTRLSPSTRQQQRSATVSWAAGEGVSGQQRSTEIR